MMFRLRKVNNTNLDKRNYLKIIFIGYRVILPKAVSEGCSKKDVLYLALTRKSCGTATLYFTYLCSKKLFAIKTDYLRDGRISGKIEGKMFSQNNDEFSYYKHIIFEFRYWHETRKFSYYWN